MVAAALNMAFPLASRQGEHTFLAKLPKVLRQTSGIGIPAMQICMRDYCKCDTLWRNFLIKH
jgi:hypothetical protein